MTFVNYYEELKVSESASLSEIQAAIKETRRRYRSLAGSPNLEQRSLAEKKMVILSEADQIFSSEESKSSYDKELKDYLNQHQTSQETTETTDTSNGGLDDLLAKARHAYSNDSLGTAIIFARRATAEYPKSIEAWKLLSMYALENQDYDVAEEAATEALFIDRQDAYVYYLIGQTHRAQKRYDQAIKQFEKAYSLSNDDWYLGAKANILFNAGKYNQSAQLYETIAKETSKDSYYQGALEAYAAAGNINKVTEIGEMFVANRPTFDNLATYHDAIPAWTPKKWELQKLIFDKYGTTYTYVQNQFLDCKFQEKFVDFRTADGNIVFDSRKKIKLYKEYLDEMKEFNITDSRALKSLQKEQEQYESLVNREVAKSGCTGWGIALFLVWLIYRNLGQNFLFALVLAGALYLYVTNVLYIPKWKVINKSK